jgi:hypothetical protein
MAPRRHNRKTEPVVRSTVMFQGKIPVNLPGYYMSYWFRRMLKYWIENGQGTVYMAHRYGGKSDPVKGSSCKGYMYGRIVGIAEMYADLNPHLIRQVPGTGKTEFVYIYKGE